MLTITNDANIQTVITTFEVNPATCQDLFEELSAACREVISKQPGYIASALHINDARTRIADRFDSQRHFPAVFLDRHRNFYSHVFQCANSRHNYK